MPISSHVFFLSFFLDSIFVPKCTAVSSGSAGGGGDTQMCDWYDWLKLVQVPVFIRATLRMSSFV